MNIPAHLQVAETGPCHRGLSWVLYATVWRETELEIANYWALLRFSQLLSPTWARRLRHVSFLKNDWNQHQLKYKDQFCTKSSRTRTSLIYLIKSWTFRGKSSPVRAASWRLTFKDKEVIVEDIVNKSGLQSCTSDSHNRITRFPGWFAGLSI